MALISTDSSSRNEILRYAQLAPQFIETQAVSVLPQFAARLLSSESTEQWDTYEKLLISCLKTGDDQSAHTCIEKLIERFGSSNEHIMALRGLCQEAVAADSQSLVKVLEEYEDVLRIDPTNFSIMKRRASLLKELSRFPEAINTIIQLLDLSPTDVEAWIELSDLYLCLGMFLQAMYCIEEALLIVPNAWNIHARLGEVMFLSTSLDAPGTKAEHVRRLIDAVQYFCRSIELCDGYLRGYYGLKLASGRLLRVSKGGGTTLAHSDSFDLITIQELNTKATSQIAKIVDEPASGYREAELIAAKELLDRDPSNE